MSEFLYSSQYVRLFLWLGSSDRVFVIQMWIMWCNYMGLQECPGIIPFPLDPK